ncbi:MAG: FAD binding domain-containing protein, partial [Calditrichaeota bacterium]|nr:FAD binding domain-containing protein [Calditrichota bacterium]
MRTKVEFIRAETINQALQLLADNNKNTRILAGGTDIITGMRMKSKRFANIDLLLDINSINDLKGIRLLEDSVTIGSNVTFSEILENKIIQDKLPLLIQSASGIGNLQIRNR